MVSVGATEQSINNYKTLNEKVQGPRIKKSEAPNPIETTTDPANSTTALVKKTISVSQQSFDNIIEHYDKIIKLLVSIPAYNPTVFHTNFLSTQR